MGVWSAAGGGIANSHRQPTWTSCCSYVPLSRFSRRRSACTPSSCDVCRQRSRCHLQGGIPMACQCVCFCADRDAATRRRQRRHQNAAAPHQVTLAGPPSTAPIISAASPATLRRLNTRAASFKSRSCSQVGEELNRKLASTTENAIIKASSLQRLTSLATDSEQIGKEGTKTVDMMSGHLQQQARQQLLTARAGPPSCLRRRPSRPFPFRPVWRSQPQPACLSPWGPFVYRLQ